MILLNSTNPLHHIKYTDPSVLSSPVEGDVARGWEIGHGSTYASGKVIYRWTKCPSCGKLRWVPKNRWIRSGGGCLSCSQLGSRDNYWRGGDHTNAMGYRVAYLAPGDPFMAMARRTSGRGRTTGGGYVLEHRLVVARHLGRVLDRWEVIHHKNGDKLDNRLDNLEVVVPSEHASYTLLEQRIRQLEARVVLLESENALLRTQSSMDGALIRTGQGEDDFIVR